MFNSNLILSSSKSLKKNAKEKDKRLWLIHNTDLYVLWNKLTIIAKIILHSKLKKYDLYSLEFLFVAKTC